MTNEIIFLVSESPEGGFEARALGHSIYTEADTSDELREMVRDAVSVHLPLVDSTRGLFGAEFFGAMKPGAATKRKPASEIGRKATT